MKHEKYFNSTLLYRRAFHFPGYLFRLFSRFTPGNRKKDLGRARWGSGCDAGTEVLSGAKVGLRGTGYLTVKDTGKIPRHANKHARTQGIAYK
jgi:hypothetical protein